MQLDSVSSLLELDPASMPGLAATLDLYAKGTSAPSVLCLHTLGNRPYKLIGPHSWWWSTIVPDHLSLAEAIKRVARLVELIPGDESLWALLWQSLEQLAQHHLTPVRPRRAATTNSIYLFIYLLLIY